MSKSQQFGDDELNTLKGMIYDMKASFINIVGYCELILMSQELKDAGVDDLMSVEECVEVINENGERALTTLNEAAQYIIELQESSHKGSE